MRIERTTEIPQSLTWKGRTVDNVTPIGPRQKKKQSKGGDGGDKLTQAQRQLILADWVDGLNCEAIGLEPPRQFAVLLREDEERLVVEVSNGEITASDVSAVASMIAQAVRLHCTDNELWQMSDSQIVQAASFWARSTKGISNPPRYGWQGDDGLVMRRLPFEMKGGDTPIWDELMSRITNAEALMAFIGSILVEGSDMQQYVWLHGQGGEGKGALCRFLAKALGHTYSSQQTPGINDRFWTWGMRHNRLVVFPDCNNTSFVTSGLFKSLTGDDPIRIEIKGGRVLHQRIRAKFMFLSNERPDLSSEIADRRRIIYCSAKAFDGKVNPKYETLLWKEGGQFLTKCLETYYRMCPEGEPIDCSAADIDEIIAANEDHFETFLQSNFYIGPAQECTRVAFLNRVSERFKKRSEQKAFREYLARKGIVVKARANAAGNVDRYWSGIRLREAVLSGLVGVDPNIS